MRIVVLTDSDLRGSGYKNLSMPLLEGLTEYGHEIKVLGLGYHGEEHQHPFGIIPTQNFQEVFAMLQNLVGMWEFDVFLVLLDVPLQERVLSSIQDRKYKYVGVMPIEADPLCMSWAMVLMQMDKAFIISEFGTAEAEKMGVFHAEHIRIGVDTESWRMPTEDEKRNIRKSLGNEEDDFIVLTVADNQERKNLARAMEIVSDVDSEHIKYNLVTREHNPVGWKLRDFAQEVGINKIFSIYERGISFKQLWSLYAIADAFLLPSKAEGLGLPLLEAQSVGIPCVGTDCTAIAELLGDNRGYLIDPDYIYRDPFGNGNRYLASRKHGASIIQMLHDNRGKSIGIIKNAREYVEGRDWQTPIDQLNEALEKLNDE